MESQPGFETQTLLNQPGATTHSDALPSELRCNLILRCPCTLISFAVLDLATTHPDFFAPCPMYVSHTLISYAALYLAATPHPDKPQMLYLAMPHPID
jgi:hypothetical protein